MYTPDPDLPAKPHHFMSKRLGISISLVLFVLVLLLSYALCSLQVDRSTQAILADKNRFLLSNLTSPQELTYTETKHEAAVSPGKTTLCLPCPALSRMQRPAPLHGLRGYVHPFRLRRIHEIPV